MKKRNTLSAEERHRIFRKMVRETFVQEGTMVAFPLCFPGVTTPIPPDESRVTALAGNAEGIIHGGTSGRQAHLFVAALHGAMGLVLDLGTVDGATESVAVCCGEKRVVAAMNGAGGGRLVFTPYQAIRADLLQEWSFRMTPLDGREPVVPGERIVDMVAAASGSKVVGVTEQHLFTLDIEDGEAAVVQDMAGTGRLVSIGGAVYGTAGDGCLWRFDTGTGILEPRAIEMPAGQWRDGFPRWAAGPEGACFAADAEGTIFRFSEEDGFGEHAMSAPLTPVKTMAVTPDGRLFGFCGDGIGRLFCLDRGAEETRKLGAAVSVMERRRYGYSLACATLGRDGNIIFGEDDDLGHLWVYFPRILGSDADR